MTAHVSLGIAIPQTFPDRPIDPRAIRRFLARAEALNYQSAWVVDHLMGELPALDAIELLTWASGVTERIRLGAAVLLTALRSPVHLAKSLATLDHLSQGRLVVGVGLGGNAGAYPVVGLPPERRAARFAEGIRLMTRLWTESRVNVAGDFWTLKDVTIEPKPFQKPHPPLWFGAHHPNALRRAVELGQGFMGAGSASTATFAEEVNVLEGMLRSAGRDPATFPIGKRVYIAVDRDRQRAGKRLAEWFAGFYGRAQLAEEVSVWGSRDECVEGLRAVVAAGARLLVLNPVFDEMEQLEQLAADVAPAL